MAVNDPQVAYHPEKVVSVNGIRLCFDSFGNPSDPAILMIMGLATQLVHWDEELCKLLAQRGFYVVRFDNRDVGRSSKLSHLPIPSFPNMLANLWFKKRLHAPYTLQDMACDGFALLDYLNIKQAHLVGASMGGMIAQTMAILDPARVKSLTSIMSTTGARNLPRPNFSVTLKVMRPVAKDEESFVRQTLGMWRLLHGKHYPFNSERVKNMIILARKRSFYPSGVLRQLGAIIASGDRTQALAKVSLPTLVIHGDSDPLVPYPCGVATANAIAGAALKTYSGMGHTLPDVLWVDIVNEIEAHAKAAT